MQARRGLEFAPIEAQALAALDASAKEFHGDRARTYLTGFSMLGYGTWSIAATHGVTWLLLTNT